jgi:hypothetical protein
MTSLLRLVLNPHPANLELLKRLMRGLTLMIFFSLSLAYADLRLIDGPPLGDGYGKCSDGFCYYEDVCPDFIEEGGPRAHPEYTCGGTQPPADIGVYFVDIEPNPNDPGPCGDGSCLYEPVCHEPGEAQNRDLRGLPDYLCGSGNDPRDLGNTPPTDENPPQEEEENPGGDGCVFGCEEPTEEPTENPTEEPTGEEECTDVLGMPCEEPGETDPEQEPTDDGGNTGEECTDALGMPCEGGTTPTEGGGEGGDGGIDCEWFGINCPGDENTEDPEDGSETPGGTPPTEGGETGESGGDGGCDIFTGEGCGGTGGDDTPSTGNPEGGTGGGEGGESGECNVFAGDDCGNGGGDNPYGEGSDPGDYEWGTGEPGTVGGGGSGNWEDFLGDMEGYYNEAMPYLEYAQSIYSLFKDFSWDKFMDIACQTATGANGDGTGDSQTAQEITCKIGDMYERVASIAEDGITFREVADEVLKEVSLADLGVDFLSAEQFETLGSRVVGVFNSDAPIFERVAEMYDIGKEGVDLMEASYRSGNGGTAHDLINFSPLLTQARNTWNQEQARTNGTMLETYLSLEGVQDIATSQVESTFTETHGEGVKDVVAKFINREAQSAVSTRATVQEVVSAITAYMAQDADQFAYLSEQLTLQAQQEVLTTNVLQKQAVALMEMKNMEIAERESNIQAAIQNSQSIIADQGKKVISVFQSFGNFDGDHEALPLVVLK